MEKTLKCFHGTYSPLLSSKAPFENRNQQWPYGIIFTETMFYNQEGSLNQHQLNSQEEGTKNNLMKTGTNSFFGGWNKKSREPGLKMNKKSGP